MPAPLPRAQRKVPQQQRSRAMVERILDAARDVLVEDGHDAASTNRIARRAGISPGSLYQYFPNKEAVVDAVVERWSEELSARVTASFTDHLHERGEPLVRSTLEALLDALEENAALLRVVVENLPRSAHGARIAALEQQVSDLVSTYLAAQRTVGRGIHPPTAAWLMVRTVEQLTVRYVLDRPDIARTEFVSELGRLLTGYLGGEPSA